MFLNDLFRPINFGIFQDKAHSETLDHASLKWFTEMIRCSIHSKFLHSSQPDNEDGYSIIVIHGAGSFGHMQAKEFGLRGQSDPPTSHDSSLYSQGNRNSMFGLAKVRSR